MKTEQQELWLKMTGGERSQESNELDESGRSERVSRDEYRSEHNWNVKLQADGRQLMVDRLDYLAAVSLWPTRSRSQ